MSTDDEITDSGVSTDIIAILDAVELPIVVIGDDRRVFRFNRAAATLLHLTSSDIGRSPSEVLHGVEDLDKLCADVLAGGIPSRREIRDGERCFIMRIAAYGQLDRPIVGAVLTFTNVTAFRASIDQAIYEREYTKAILNTVIEPLVVLDTNFCVQTANRAFYTMFGLSRDETHGVPFQNLGNKGWKRSGLWESLNTLKLQNSEFPSVEIEREFPVIGQRTVLVDARRITLASDSMLLLALHDITERKNAEELVHQRTAQFQTLLNESPLGVYLIDQDFRIREANPTALRVFGNIPDLVGRDFDEVIHILWSQEFADELVERFRHTLETGEAYFVPERIEERRDIGVREYYEWQINRIPLPEGGYGVVCYFQDISRQILARNAIAESEQRFRTLVSVITDVPWTVDPEGRFVVPQQAWAAYTGQTWEQHRDLGWADAIHKDDRPQVLNAWKHAYETCSLYQTQGRLWHAASQAYRHFEARATPVLSPDGKVREWVGSCTDIDERRVFENALRKSEERLRFMAESMPAKIFTTGPDGDVDYFNQQWFDYTGLSLEEMKVMGWTHFIHPSDVAETIRVWQHSLDTGEPFQFVHRFRRVDGAYRWHLSRARSMRGLIGAISMWITSSTDIHEEKQTEEELRKANADLNYFAFAASHDLQEPLRMIASYSQLLLKSYRGQLEGNASLYVDYITEGTTRMSELLSDLLSFTALSADDRHAAELIDLDTIIQKTTQNLRTAIDETSAVIVADRLPVIEGHEGHFLPLFQNLVSNAIKYRSERSPIVEIAVENRKTEWLFSVVDNGIGIAPEYHQGIFGVFKRLHGRKIPGTGIGLAICQRVVERYGGRIWVESEVGNGATFRFTLPRREKS